MRNRLAVVVASLSAATLIFAFACGGKKPPVTPEPPVTETVPDAGEDTEVPDAATKKTLFERLGGKDGIGQVVDAFIKNIQADNRVSKLLREGEGGSHAAASTTCSSTSCARSRQGPCTYQGQAT